MSKQKMIYERIQSVFKKGELLRIKETGEVYTYEKGEGGANFSTIVTISVNNGKFTTEIGMIWLHSVEKVDKSGNVIDDFSSLRN